MNTPPLSPGRESLLRALEDGGVSYVLIGGAALETHHQPHRTDDVDIARPLTRSTSNISPTCSTPWTADS